ncbi:MAG TPA: hypothetical protein DET40_21635 [Lentisphaeria bacterium]|nr:hypothetical protein [Lentisphaeria bacterium]
MKCPKCGNEMITMPLKEAIKNGLAKACPDKDFPDLVFDDIIEDTDFAVCPGCGFVMMPPKQK